MKITIKQNAQLLWQIRSGNRTEVVALGDEPITTHVAKRAAEILRELNAASKIKKLQTNPNKVGDVTTYYADGVADKIHFDEIEAALRRAMVVNDSIEIVVKQEPSDEKKLHRAHYRAVRRLGKGKKIRSEVGFCTASEDLKTFTFTPIAGQDWDSTVKTFATAAEAIDAMDAVELAAAKS